MRTCWLNVGAKDVISPVVTSKAIMLARGTVFWPGEEPAGRALEKLPPT